jgi:nicotinate-nucleotide adenylyltransferase
MARVGIFSGTFDPVHKGHIAFCLAAMQAGRLDRVVLLPEPEPRGKVGVAPLAHRRAMLELAIQNQPGLEVLQLPGRRFTVAETLPELERRFASDELSLLIGSDVVRSLERGWPGQERLLASMGLIVGLRAGDTEERLRRQLAVVAGRSPRSPLRVTFIGSPHAAAASSRIRENANAAGLMPAVAAYIATHQLYALAA